MRPTNWEYFKQIMALLYVFSWAGVGVFVFGNIGVRTLYWFLEWRGIDL